VSERGRGPLPHTRASERGRHEQIAWAAASELGRPGARHAATLDRAGGAPWPSSSRRGRAGEQASCAATAELGTGELRRHAKLGGQASCAATAELGAGELRRHAKLGAGKLRRHGRAGGRRAAPPRQAGGRRAAPPRRVARKAGAGSTTGEQAATAARKAEPGLRRARRAGRAGGRWRARRTGPGQPDGRGDGGEGGSGQARRGRAPMAERRRPDAQGPRHDGLAALGVGRGERTPDRAGETGGPRAVAPCRAHAGEDRGRGSGLEHAARDGEEERGEEGEGKGEDGDELTSTIVAAAILHGREARRASCAR
jgi:hypothetical protein